MLGKIAFRRCSNIEKPKEPDLRLNYQKSTNRFILEKRLKGWRERQSPDLEL
jgi:hypothetical protein